MGEIFFYIFILFKCGEINTNTIGRNPQIKWDILAIYGKIGRLTIYTSQNRETHYLDRYVNEAVAIKR